MSFLVWIQPVLGSGFELEIDPTPYDPLVPVKEIIVHTLAETWPDQYPAHRTFVCALPDDDTGIAFGVALDPAIRGRIRPLASSATGYLFEFGTVGAPEDWSYFLQFQVTPNGQFATSGGLSMPTLTGLIQQLMAQYPNAYPYRMSNICHLAEEEWLLHAWQAMHVL